MTYQTVLNKLKTYMIQKQDNRNIVVYIVSTCEPNTRGFVKTTNTSIDIVLNLFLHETKRQVIRTIIHELAHVVAGTTMHDSNFRKIEQHIKNYIKGE